MAILAAWCFYPAPLSASKAIRPYKESGKSGQFSYAIYNNQWLLHGQRALNEKHLTRVAITGVLPGAKGKIEIPSSIAGHDVYGIDDNALKSCTGVTGIVIPKTVRFLKPGTLNRCQGLENIEVAADHPDFASVDGVMFDKQKTKLLALGAGRKGRYVVPKTTTTIGPYALSLCTSLKSVVIPKSVTDIGGHTGSVFLGCKNLESIDIPGSVTNIGQKSC
ncbi:MAG: leucine-rich repeat domain-containing protein [Deltaproteobacteria bacterium]|nr:leucine-rich repeat domain-containing protein [Deltaproteobacteria bacterium]